LAKNKTFTTILGQGSIVPYFIPGPSAEQWAYWILPNGQQPLVSSWPHAGSVRTDARFRFKHITDHDWTASRYWLEFTDSFEGQEFNIKGWVDVEPTGVGRLQGNAGFHPGGWECIVTIEEYDSTPIVGSPGVVVTILWQLGFPGLSYEAKYWYLDDTFSQWSRTILLNEAAASFFQESRSWIGPFGPSDAIGGSLSDCYDFPLLEGTPGFAAGNGVDAWIALDTFTGDIVNRWQWQGDFFFRTFTRAFVLANGSVSSVITGISPTTAYFGSISVPHGGVIPLDEWVHISVERSWQSSSGALMKVFLNSVEIGSGVRGNPQLVFNRMIGNRPTNPAQFGNFDVKNFQLVTGRPEAPNVQLNMPLILNACDAGSQGNNGTTFNMDLASCE
jgi:hypothetical protein